MNYYKRHIGDYLSHTTHLTMLEHGAYNRLLDLYYLREGALPSLPECLRLVGARTDEERAAVEAVLKDFFKPLADGGYEQGRCERELLEYRGKADKNREVGKLGGRPRKPETQEEPKRFSEETIMVSENNHPGSKNNPNHKPLTINHKPEREARATRFALDSLPDDWKAFCKQERPDLTPEKTFAAFSDYWKGAPGAKGRKLDWTATWRNWVRNEKRAPQSRADLVAPKPPPNVTGYTGPEFVAPTPETLEASKKVLELLRRNAA